MPFGDSSDDSSDGEEHPNQTETNTRITNSSSDNTDSSLGSGSSPSKSVKTTSSLSPAKRSSSGSPSKSVKRGTLLKRHRNLNFENSTIGNIEIISLPQIPRWNLVCRKTTRYLLTPLAQPPSNLVCLAC